MLESTKKILKVAGKDLGLNDKKLDELIKPENVHEAELNLNNKIYKAFRVQHRNKRGPYKGGIRFHHKVDMEEVQVLALLMSLKSALFKLPLGGGKGGIIINPKEHDDKHIEDLARAYVAEFVEHLGPDKDVPAPDVNTNARLMDIMTEEYAKLTGDKSMASFTGKSVSSGGVAAREDSTGRGGAYCLEQYLKLTKRNHKNITIAVQGVGNVGYHFARIISEELGSKVIAVSNSRYTLTCKNGFNFKDSGYNDDALEQFKPQADSEDNAESIIKTGADVLVCAALSDAITTHNYEGVKADIILELANGPVSYGALNKLEKNKISVIPDILANSGGVIISYLEWRQNLNHHQLTTNEMKTFLSKKIKETTTNVYDFAHSKKIPLKQAAFEIAMKEFV